MSQVVIYSTGTCPMCEKSKTLLTKWGIPYDEKRVDLDRSALKEMSQITNGARTVPQICIEGKWIGSFTELTEMHMEDELDHLIKSES
ncbi:MAG: glutaredoxin [Gammaproteobacteria bacterium]|nr:glutaredoxin [Gammaproteobacteria bacterium]